MGLRMTDRQPESEFLPEQVHLIYDRSMTGRKLYRAGIDAQNNLRYALRPAVQTLTRITGDSSPKVHFAEVLRVANVLRREVDNPEHYGDNQPGLFTYSGSRYPEIDRFSCGDLVDFGSSGPDGQSGFLRSVGLSSDTPYLVLCLATLMALIDEAATAFDADLLTLGAHLTQRAAEWAGEAERAEIAPVVKVGERFTQGRKLGTVGPVRKAIRVALRKRQQATAAEVWAAISARPPRQMAFYDSPRLGKYIETGSPPKSTGYPRFQTIVSEERTAIRAEASRNSEGVKRR